MNLKFSLRLEIFSFNTYIILPFFFYHPACWRRSVQRSCPRCTRPFGRSTHSSIISLCSKQIQVSSQPRTNFQIFLNSMSVIFCVSQTSLWAFWTSAAACAILSSSSNSRAVEPLKLWTFEPSSEGQRSASGSGCGRQRAHTEWLSELAVKKKNYKEQRRTEVCSEFRAIMTSFLFILHSLTQVSFSLMVISKEYCHLFGRTITAPCDITKYSCRTLKTPLKCEHWRQCVQYEIVKCIGKKNKAPWGLGLR